jgi:hypothetical protein
LNNRSHNWANNSGNHCCAQAQDARDGGNPDCCILLGVRFHVTYGDRFQLAERNAINLLVIPPVSDADSSTAPTPKDRAAATHPESVGLGISLTHSILLAWTFSLAVCIHAGGPKLAACVYFVKMVMQPLRSTVDEAIIEAHCSFLLDPPNIERSKESGEAPIPGNLGHYKNPSLSTGTNFGPLYICMQPDELTLES